MSVSILAIAAAGVLPLLLGAIKAGYSVELDTQSKNLAQQQIDRMRNLPYHVDASNGPYRDLLDTYYPNLTAAVTPGGAVTVATVNTGYVAAGAARATGEPTGAFYRFVTSDASFPLFRLVVDTQLLERDLSVLTAPTTYNAATAGLDAPPARLVGITVTTSWSMGSTAKSFRLFTQIADAKPADPVIQGAARSTAVQISGSASDGTKLTAAAGYLDESGSVSTGSVANGKAVGAYIDRFPGGRLLGASQLADAPPDVTVALADTQTAKDLDAGGACTLSCFGSSAVAGLTAVVSQGLPAIGSSASPVTASLSSTGSGQGMSMTSGTTSALATLLMLSGPSALVPNVGGGGNLVTASGYLASTTGGSHAVTGHVATTVAELDVLPTSYAPRGVVYTVLSSAILDCRANDVSGGATVTGTFSATVYYWSASSNGYVALGTVRNGNVSDPLPDPATLTVYNRNGITLHLSDYIADWHSSLGALSSTVAGGQYAQGGLDGVVSITTVDLRPGDTTSGLQAKVGSLSCLAQDER